MVKRSKEKQRKLDEKIKRAQQFKKTKLPARFNIMAIDQATKAGVAFQLKGSAKISVELWDLSIGTKESQGMKWLRFEAKFRDALVSNKIKAVAYELPGGRNVKPIIHSAKMIGIMEKVCVEEQVEYLEFSSSEVKKMATGNGNANKELMVKAAREHWGYEGEDDNEADAINILMLLKAKIN
jgi:Holliday junction resolvasome RuvABC endonuclease subunit